MPASPWAAFQAIAVGLRHPDLFSSVGDFSAGLREGYVTERDMAEVTGSSGRIRLVYVRIGTSDFLLKDARRFHVWLKARSIPHVYTEVPGGHDGGVWRGGLEDLAPRLFRG